MNCFRRAKPVRCPSRLTSEESKIKGWKQTDCGKKVKVNLPLNEANSEEFDALVLPGGVCFKSSRFLILFNFATKSSRPKLIKKPPQNLSQSLPSLANVQDFRRGL
jgi:hypothetical protein